MGIYGDLYTLIYQKRAKIEKFTDMTVPITPLIKLTKELI